MERMSGADALMLYLDRAEAYNHTIKLSIIDPSADPEGWSWKRFKATWASRIGLIPRLRQRYLRVPMGLNHPVWVEDPAFDMDYHLRRVGCPAPGSMVELCELVCEFYAHPMDHTRPLWQVWVVEGLEGGRVAVILFIHHAITDGVGILRMLDDFWNTRPESEQHPSPAEWHPPPLPGKGRLLWEGLRDLPGVFAANLPGAIRGTRAGRRILGEWRRQRTHAAPGCRRLEVPRALCGEALAKPDLCYPLVLAAGNPRGRQEAWRDHQRRVHRHDLGRHPRASDRKHGKAPTQPMVATVPFSLVPLAERTRDGNYSTVCHTLLHTEIADPVKRLRACKRDADTMKAYFEATREANLAATMNLLPPAVPKIVDRVNEMKGGGLLPFWNVVVSNVPGPRSPFKLGNLKLDQWYSIGQLAHGAALNVTVWSYIDQFNLSILADPSVVKDAWRLMDHFESSLIALESAAVADQGAG